MRDRSRRTLTGVPAALAPRLWLGHLLALVFVAAAALLGVWQLDAWQTRRADEARDLTRADPVALSSVMGPDDPFPGRSVGQPVTLEGDWLATGTVFVSGREQDGRDGYWMVTPLAIGGPDAAGAARRPRLGGRPGAARRRRRRAAPTWSAGCSRPRGPAPSTTTRTTTYSRSCGSPTSCSTSTRTCTAGTPSRSTASPGCPPPSWSSSRTPAGSPRSRNLFYAVEWWFFGAFAVLIWWRWLGEQLALPSEEPQAEDEDQPDTVTT